MATPTTLSPSPSPENGLSRKSTENTIARAQSPLKDSDVKSIQAKDENKHAWGYDRRKMTEDGYRALGILATFMAAVQAQIMGSTSSSVNSSTSQIINVFFFVGLLADIFGAILSYAAARWFEMLTQDESIHLQECFLNAESGKQQKVVGMSIVDRWVALSIVIAPHIAVFGLLSFVSGLMVLLWTQQPIVVKVVVTFFCVAFALFVPPFAFKHNRRAVLSSINLKRRSG